MEDIYLVFMQFLEETPKAHIEWTVPFNLHQQTYSIIKFYILPFKPHTQTCSII